MREKKIRYTFKHVATGNVEQKIYTLSQLEERTVKELSPCFNLGFGYELIGRDDFTGLKDKNGNEIYEGDILTSTEYPFQDDGKYNYHGVVEWGEEEAAYYLALHLANKNRRGISHGISEMLGQEDMTTFEIIGNIHEHSHLLEATT